MTEAEWHEAKRPNSLFEHLGRKASARKRRLFACACYRRISATAGEDLMPEQLLLAERYADNEAAVAEIIRAGSLLGARGGYSAAWAENNALHAVLEPSPREIAERAAQYIAFHAAFLAEERLASEHRGEDDPEIGRVASESEERALVEVVRCIFGNPFRPVALDPGWRTEAVVALATGVYADRAFERLPVLADALEDAGCANADVLEHCRGDDTHARGCWVVDLILGKA